MKKLVYSAFIALVALWSVSCNKELKPEETVNPAQKAEKVKMTFTAGIQTKAFVEDGASSVDIKWDAEDHIAVWDGTEWCDFSAKSVNGSTAVFEGEITRNEAFATTDFKAVYPFAAITDPSSEAISVKVPSAQVVPSGGFVDPTALVSVATCSAEGLLSFEQVCSLVKINLTLSGMSALTLEGTGLAGTVVCASDGSVSSSSSLENTITLSSADGTFALDGNPAAADYFIAVLPGTSAPLKVGMVRESDGYTGVRSASSVTFAQGKAKVYIKDSAISEWEYNISTPEQLKNWNDGRDVAYTGKVNILADLDMDGKSWTPDDFAGVFDGQGHKIYNLSIVSSSNACFFNTVNGTVKDVVFGSSNGTSYDGSSAIVQDNPEDDGSSWRYAGVVTRLSEGSVLENVKNFAPVTVAATSLSKTRVGGLVGVVAGPSTIKNCENHGNVTNNAAAPAAAGAVGGVIGWADAVLTADNVSNFGNITVYNASTSYIGGVLANDGVGSTLSTCSNSGDIDVQFKGIIGMCIGGVLGNATSTKLTDCSNSGGINNICDGELKAGGIVGRVYRENASVDCSIINCTNKASGTISLNVESPTKNLFAGGIVGNTPGATAGTLLIQGCINRANLTIDYPYTNALGGIGGFLNGSSGGVKTTIKECENYGIISCTAKLNVAIYIGGVVGDLNAKSGAGSSIIDCKNHGQVVLNSVKATSYVGGIAAYASYADIKGCDNLEGASVRCENKYDFSQTLYIGGVFGRFYYGSVSACSNAGEVYTDNTASGSAVTVNRIGGIGGTLHGANSTLTDCVNAGAIIVDQSRVLGTGNNWQAAGGILGFQESVESTVSKNTNSGAIDCKFNTTNANASAGGIIGRFGGTLTLSDNRNSGSVTAVNVNTSSTVINCHTGGIIGSSNGGKAGSSVSGNVNTGAVSVGSTNAANSIGAGGLIGWAAVANSFGSGNKTFGSVSGTNAGAVAGINTATISATICDAVTVNGVTKAAASDEGAWLCPSNTGTITPTYVAHSSSE